MGECIGQECLRCAEPSSTAPLPNVVRATAETRIYLHTCRKGLSPPSIVEKERPPDREQESCLACGMPRHPRYRSTTAWAKHRLWCGPGQERAAGAIPFSPEGRHIATDVS